MEADGGAADGWPACSGPRVSVGGLQRACRLPAKHVSCPVMRSLPGPEPGPPGGGLDCVLPGLFIASGAAAARRDDLAAARVTHVVNAAPSVELCWHAPHLDYLCVDVLDGPQEPIGRHFARVNAFVASARAAGGTVLVHCHGGVSRAATLVCAFLIAHEGLSFDAALAALRRARPIVEPNPGFCQQLRAFEAAVVSGGAAEAMDDATVGGDPDTPDLEGEGGALLLGARRGSSAGAERLTHPPHPPLLLPPPARASSR